MTDSEQEGPARPYPDWAYEDGYSPRRGVTAPLVLGGIVQFFVSLVTPKPDLGAAMAGPRELAEASGEFAASISISVVVIGIVLYAAFFRTRDPRGTWKIPVVLLPLALIATLLSTLAAGAVNEGEQRRLAQRSMAETFRHFIESNGRDAGPLRRSGATGEYGEIEGVMLQFFGDLSERTRRYETDVQALAGIFEPENMRRAADAARATERAAHLPETIRTYINDLRRAPQDLRRRLQRANLSEATRREVAEGFEEGLADAAEENARIYALELEIAETALELLGVLRRTEWQRDRSGNFMFSSDAALGQFEPVRVRLERLGTEQERLIAERRRQVTRELRDFERLR